MKILLIDNYDSFTYNLVQIFRELGAEVVVRRNDEIDLETLGMSPDYIVFSPGPGTVENTRDLGKGIEIFQHFLGKVPILGVCFGHQMIGKYFGGIIQKVVPVHGKRDHIRITDRGTLFQNLPQRIQAMRYHSLVVDGKTLPSALTPTATSQEGHVMAFENAAQKVFGLQFHPESIGTPSGKTILRNFLQTR